DRAQDSEPLQSRLLEGVDAIKLRFMDQQLQWHQSWPPLTLNTDTDEALLPIGIEVTLELRKEGEIRRLFRTVDFIW
ncbi:MAG: type II secretion system protein GspJ, partial [Gammaproteobacteria bacterium]|nr:type II secretion system protein GspJ [Gammaproteobacteria bacterium]